MRANVGSKVMPDRIEHILRSATLTTHPLFQRVQEVIHGRAMSRFVECTIGSCCLACQIRRVRTLPQHPREFVRKPACEKLDPAASVRATRMH
jgi:hypothetical protein